MRFWTEPRHSHITFRQREDRHEAIDSAHQNTFDWVFKPTNPWTRSDFLEWLDTGTGVFWVSGKAGSGKSTLLKFLDGHTQTKEALKNWTEKNSLPLVTASYYFWNPGTAKQKTRHGLLQTLIFQILTQQPDLIPVAFPVLYETLDFDGFPTFIDLKRAFSSILNQPHLPINLFLLIDGLDECEADGTEMAEISESLIELSLNSRVKIILSSRPLQLFEESFGEGTRLKLDELIYKDITTNDPQGVSDLIETIVRSANGVFLWVKLVIRSLVEGLRNYDGVAELRQRLHKLPPDLKDLFRGMWRNIDTQYRMQASQYLQLVICAIATDVELSAVTLFSATQKAAEFAPLSSRIPLDAMQKMSMIKEMDGRIRSRCLGLLEMSDDSAGVPNVQFLHHSAVESIAQPDFCGEVLSETAHTDFNSYVSLLQSYVHQIRKWSPRDGSDNFIAGRGRCSVWSLVRGAMESARLAEKSTGKAQTRLLHELDIEMAIHSKAALEKLDELEPKYWIHHWSNWLNPCKPHMLFLPFAVQHGLVLYVQDYLSQWGWTPWKHILQYLVELVHSVNLSALPATKNIAELLIIHGADANALIDLNGDYYGRRCSALRIVLKLDSWSIHRIHEIQERRHSTVSACRKCPQQADDWQLRSHPSLTKRMTLQEDEMKHESESGLMAN